MKQRARRRVVIRCMRWRRNDGRIRFIGYDFGYSDNDFSRVDDMIEAMKYCFQAVNRICGISTVIAGHAQQKQCTTATEILTRA